MKLSDYIKQVAPDLNLEDGWEVQVNYRPIDLKSDLDLALAEEDIVRFQKPFETPRQYIVGEE